LGPDTGLKRTTSWRRTHELRVSPGSAALHAGLTQHTGMAAPAPGVPTWHASLAQRPRLPAPMPGIRILGHVAPPKLELTIFSWTIPSMPNASQWKDNLSFPWLSLQLSMTRATMSLHCYNPQCFVFRYRVTRALSHFSILYNAIKPEQASNLKISWLDPLHGMSFQLYYIKVS